MLDRAHFARFYRTCERAKQVRLYPKTERESVCVCVLKREREREREGARVGERERGRGGITARV